MEKIKIDKQQRKNLFASIRNFFDIADNIFQDCSGEIRKEKDVLRAFYVIWDLAHDYGMFCKNLKDEYCLSDIKLSLETFMDFCKKSGKFQYLLPSLEEAKDICFYVIDNKMDDKIIEINNKQWKKNVFRNVLCTLVSKKKIYRYVFLYTPFSYCSFFEMDLALAKEFEGMEYQYKENEYNQYLDDVLYYSHTNFYY